jgi:hypothetical protein
MGHAHAHAQGEGDGTFFLDQLFTILAAGALGLVAILMCYVVDDKGTVVDGKAPPFLARILVPMFFPWVLGGGIAIMLMAAVRAIAVWQLAGQRRREFTAEEPIEHDHGHSHVHAQGEECGHDHEHEGDCDDDHSHSHAHSHAAGDEEGHDHSWAPWRYMVIAIPVFLYFLGLPRPGFSDANVERQMSSGELSNPNRKALSFLAGGPVLTKALRKEQPDVRKLGFKELAQAAAMPALHDNYEGDIGIIRGQFAAQQGNDREFTLFRMKMTCCQADAIMLETRVVSPEPLNVPNQAWVTVKGVISFEKTDKGKWVPVLTLKSNDDIDTNTEPVPDADSF